MGIRSLEHLHDAGSPLFQEGGDYAQYGFYQGLGSGGIHSAVSRGRGSRVAQDHIERSLMEKVFHNGRIGNVTLEKGKVLMGGEGKGQEIYRNDLGDGVKGAKKVEGPASGSSPHVKDFFRAPQDVEPFLYFLQLVYRTGWIPFSFCPLRPVIVQNTHPYTVPWLTCRGKARTFYSMQVLSLLRRPFRYRYTNVALVLILVNVVCFFFRNLAPREALYYFSMIPARVARDGAIWQVFTYMFFHADLSHLFFNMLGLFFFGFQVEQRMGSTEFLLFYLFSGLIAGIFSFLVFYFSGATGIILLGASGAIYAVLLAFAVFFPHAVIYVMGIIPVRAPILVMIYAGIEIFSQVFNVRGGVAHLTHLAGLGAAWVYFLVRLRIDPLSVFFDRRY